MIQQETMLQIADNSGVKSALCIKVLGHTGSRKGKDTRPTAGVGDVVSVAIKNPEQTVLSKTKRMSARSTVRKNEVTQP